MVTRALVEERGGVREKAKRVTVATGPMLYDGETQDGLRLQRRVLFNQCGGAYEYRPRVVVRALSPVAQREVGTGSRSPIGLP